MKRRDALRTLGGVGTMGLLGTTNLLTDAAYAAEPVAHSQAFASSFSGFKEYRKPITIRFDHPLPIGLEGTLYRNGPALMERGNFRYHHWFDGDGMIQSFRLHGQTLTHSAKVVRTPKYEAEKRAGRFLWSGFGTAIPEAISPQKPDDVNVANISVLPVGDELLALWEAGSPWRIDPATLDTVGRKVFSPETDGLPFSAHPRVDKQGRIWNFGYMTGKDQLVLYELTAAGALKRATVISAAKTNMVHDFVMTDRYLIFALMPIDFVPPTDRGIPSFLSMLSWNDNSAVDILVIEKETLSVVRKIEMPSFFAFHFGNAWQDGEQLRIETARAPEFHTLMQQIEQATSGLPIKADVASLPAMDIVVDLKKGTANTDVLPFERADFPCFDNRYSGVRTNTLVMLERSPGMPQDVFGFDSVSAFNRETGSQQSWSYGPTSIAEEHIFVAKPSQKEGEGWLIGTAFNWRSQQTQLSVFDVSSLSTGPIASAKLPYALPIGLHGKFVASTS